MKVLLVLPILLLAAALILIFTSLGSPPTDLLLVGAIATSHFSIWYKIGKIEGKLDVHLRGNP